jgi:tripartite-type tricarboxylate transporter receptor subunit TctC
MGLHRRGFTLGTLAAAASLAAPRIAGAQGAWPERPVRIVVPFAPGGSTDTVARTLAERLSANLGRPFFVENRPGLAGTIGVDNVAKAAPDGHSFVVITTNQAVNETLQPRRPFVLTRDLVPVAAINSLNLVFAVNNDVPARNLAELVAHAKAHPGAINFASSGPGSLFHLSTEILASRAGVEMTHVPFRQYNEARTQLIGGQIQLMSDAEFTLEPLITGGRMRGIATTGAQRSTLFPNLAPVAETFPGYDIALWNGLIAPAATPRPIIERMNAEVNKVLADAAFAQAQARMGIALTPMAPEAFGAMIARDIERMRDAVRLANVQPE